VSLLFNDSSGSKVLDERLLLAERCPLRLDHSLLWQVALFAGRELDTNRKRVSGAGGARWKWSQLEIAS